MVSIRLTWTSLRVYVRTSKLYLGAILPCQPLWPLVRLDFLSVSYPGLSKDLNGNYGSSSFIRSIHKMQGLPRLACHSRLYLTRQGSQRIARATSILTERTRYQNWNWFGMSSVCKKRNSLAIIPFKISLFQIFTIYSHVKTKKEAPKKWKGEWKGIEISNEVNPRKSSKSL